MEKHQIRILLNFVLHILQIVNSLLIIRFTLYGNMACNLLRKKSKSFLLNKKINLLKFKKNKSVFLILGNSSFLRQSKCITVTLTEAN